MWLMPIVKSGIVGNGLPWARDIQFGVQVKIYLLLKTFLLNTSLLNIAATRPLMLEELTISPSQQSRRSSIRRTSQSTRDRLGHSSGHLSSEIRANQRRHVSQSTSFTGVLTKNVTDDYPLQLDCFRKSLERSSIYMQPDFDNMLEASLGKVEQLLPDLPEDELLELLGALADKLDELLYPPKGNTLRIRAWGKRLKKLCQLLPPSSSKHSPRQALVIRAEAMMNMLSPSIAYINSVEKWDDHSFHAGGTVIFAVGFYRRFFRALCLRDPILSYRSHSYIDNTIII